MRRNLSRVIALVAPAIVVYVSPAWGQYVQSATSPTKAVATSYYEGSEEGGEAKEPSAQPTPMNGSGGCNSGCDSCCDSCDVWAGCDDCPTSGIVLFSGFESWRGFADGSWVNNNGASTGFNFGTAFGGLEDYGVGFQFGASYGIYDWNGRGFPGAENTDDQEQVFITTGFFRKADGCSHWSAGIVYDYMINNNFGVFANEPTIGQWRGQISYAVSSCDEFGVWGAFRDKGFEQNTPIAGGVVAFRGVDQFNTFWHHKFDQGADSWVWIGLPDQTKLGGNGSLGDFIFGGSVTAPLSERWAVYGNAQYMHPSAAAGVAGSMEETWNVGFGLAYYPGCNARTRTVSGNCFMPLMNVANNGTFMVDASEND